MSDDQTRYSGGCLCGAVRYEAIDEPIVTGHCHCRDCQKASGSGFIPFMLFDAAAVRFTGETVQVRSTAMRGTDAVRNRCARCGSLVFGGIVGVDGEHTVYAGTLDDPSRFMPAVAIFTRDRPEWVTLPAGVLSFETMPE
jgi:hypothetical protein